MGGREATSSYIRLFNSPIVVVMETSRNKRPSLSSADGERMRRSIVCRDCSGSNGVAIACELRLEYGVVQECWVQLRNMLTAQRDDSSDDGAAFCEGRLQLLWGLCFFFRPASFGTV